MPPAMVSTKQKGKAIETPHKLRRLCGRDGRSRKQVEQYWWPEMCVEVEDWVKKYEQCKKRAPLQYAEPLRSLTISHLRQWVEKDISYIPKMVDGSHLLLVAREFLSGWAEVSPHKRRILEKVSEYSCKEVICRFGILSSVADDRGAENKKMTYLVLKCHHIRKITVFSYYYSANGVMEWGHRPIDIALSKLTASSNNLKQIEIHHLPAVLWANEITVIHSTRYSPFCCMFGQVAVLLVELENFTWNTANWSQGIDTTELLIVARASQLEQSQEDNDTTIHNRNELRDANTCNFNQAANRRTGDLQIGDLTLVHKTNIEKCHGTNLDAR